MSYILDALKKSEQDRGNGSIPNVQTIHSSALNYHQDKPSLWPWILIAILVANIFILVYFLKPDTNTQDVMPNQNAVANNIEATHQNTPAVIVSPEPRPVATETPAVIAITSEQKKPIKNNISIEAEAIATNTSKPLVTIDELAANIRQQIPDMIFSSHVYSSSAVQRSLVINDRFMEEGDVVGHDLVLVEITLNGAIFDFRGQLFSVSVLTGWGTH